MSELCGLEVDTSVPSPGVRSFPFTDLGNAERLVHWEGADLRYCAEWGAWLAWDGRVWCRDRTGEIVRRAAEVVRRIGVEAELLDEDEQAEALKSLHKHARRSESRAALSSMTALARSKVPVLTEELDAYAWKLSVANGTLDLRAGELAAHRREDLITRVTEVAFDPEAKCPVFARFMASITCGDEHLEGWLQRFAGYCLTGDVSEQVLAVFFGGGANGKSTLVKAWMRVLGPYAMQGPPTLLLARYGEEHPTEVASLKGARLVACAEVEEGVRWGEARVKQLTGGDPISARFLHKDFFTFLPSHKLLVALNHKPTVRGTDHGIWRRLRLVPFDARIAPADRDPDLDDKLAAEAEGILAWMVRGCQAWQRDGLAPTDRMREAVESYRELSPARWCRLNFGR